MGVNPAGGRDRRLTSSSPSVSFSSVRKKNEERERERDKFLTRKVACWQFTSSSATAHVLVQGSLSLSLSSGEREEGLSSSSLDGPAQQTQLPLQAQPTASPLCICQGRSRHNFFFSGRMPTRYTLTAAVLEVTGREGTNDDGLPCCDGCHLQKEEDRRLLFS